MQSTPANHQYARVFEPTVGEFDDILINDITGVLPPELSGTLYRNGPVRWEAGGFYAQHLFDGDGMVAKFVLADGRVHYRNRYVRTPKYLAEQAGKGATIRGLGTQRPGGLLANAGRLPADRSNTHAIYYAQKLLTLSDDGPPRELDPDSLATLGAYRFGGQLPALATFSPHPKFDPHTGEMFNWGIAVNTGPRRGALAALRCYRIDHAGKLHTIATIALEHLRIGHDFGLTEKYLVFVLDPLVLARPVHAALGLLDVAAATEFRTELGSRVILVPRDGSTPRQFDIPAIAKVHVNNAYDDGDDVVFDTVRYEDWDALTQLLADFRGHDTLRGGVLSRLRISKSNHVSVEDLCPLLGEFPMHDWRRTSLYYRYSYLVHADGENPTQIVKVDNHTHAHTAYAGFGAGDFPGEPIFVPRSDHAAEDDGWLLLITYLAGQHRNALLVLDARHLDGPPVAVARLPHHFMPGFHGMFTHRISPTSTPT